MEFEYGVTIFIPPENPEELVNAIKALKSDPEKCRKMGRAGRAFVENNYDRSVLARKYLALLGKVAAQPQRRGLIVSRKGAPVRSAGPTG